MVRAWRKVFLVLGGLIIVAAVVGVWVLVPSPPKRVRIATGAEEGMYMEAARRYRELMARDGVELIIVPTSGSIENLRLLRGPRRGVDLAFVQGGTAPPDAPDIEALGSVFLEPLWVFVRASVQVGRLADLRGRRIAVGAAGSGTQALARQLLEASGIGDDPRLRELGGRDAVQALLNGTVEAAFFVTAKPRPLLEPLLRAPGIRLLSLSQADAFARRHHFLTKVVLPVGALDLAAGVPAIDITLLAPAASLVTHRDLHPAIVDLVLEAATRVHRRPQLFGEAGQFPSPHHVDLPLNADAQRWFRSGPTFLRRHLPFWAATVVERLVILLPLLAVAVPVLNYASGSFQARFERRIHRAYGRLRSLETQARSLVGPDDRERVLERLEELETEVCRLKLPANQVEHLYHLRTHIQFIRRVLRDGEPAETTSANRNVD